ncbi:D-alanyl-lipoteichoic acid biosynthesis protein DltD, partial [Clostridioides difficile]
PKYYFNTNRSKNKVFAIGRAYTQTLQDAAILGSMNPNIDNKKFV